MDEIGVPLLDVVPENNAFDTLYSLLKNFFPFCSHRHIRNIDNNINNVNNSVHKVLLIVNNFILIPNIINCTHMNLMNQIIHMKIVLVLIDDIIDRDIDDENLKHGKKHKNNINNRNNSRNKNNRDNNNDNNITRAPPKTDNDGFGGENSYTYCKIVIVIILPTSLFL